MHRALSTAGVVLAGGRSSRMGTDKAALVWNGKTFLERQIDLLESLACEEIFISVRKDQSLQVSRGRLLEDPIADAGPMVGIASALAETHCDALWVIAVDLPLLEASWMQLLEQASCADSGAVFRSEKGIEPLIGYYPKSLLDVLDAAIRAGNYSVQDLLKNAEIAGKMHCIEMPKRMLDSCLNCNSPEDLAMLRKRE